MSANVKELQSVVEQILEKVLEREDLFVVGVRIGGAGKIPSILVYLDGDQGIDVEACSAVSHRLSAELDQMEALHDGYKLEVSSPGIDQPLRLLRQYPRNTGRRIRMTLRDGNVVKGVLTAVDGEVVRLDCMPKRGGKKGVAEVLSVRFEDIERAVVEVSFH
jgi:ribosome maturation factor RimP